MIHNIHPKFRVTQDVATLNVFHANVGEGLPKQAHPYSYLTMCHASSCVVRKENKKLAMTKDTQPVNLLANEQNEIEALEDGTVFVNVFSEGKY